MLTETTVITFFLYSSEFVARSLSHLVSGNSQHQSSPHLSRYIHIKLGLDGSEINLQPLATLYYFINDRCFAIY